MHVTFGEILIWLIVGSLIGSIVGRLSTRYKNGYGPVPNLILANQMGFGLILPGRK